MTDGEGEKTPDLPLLSQLEGPARALLLAQSPQRFKAGTVLFSVGMACRHFLLVNSGRVRVSVQAAGGRQIVLYRVGPGDICILTTCSLLSGNNYEAEGVVEEDMTAIVLTKPVLNELMRLSPQFSNFILSSFGGRLQGLITLIQDVVDRHVDRRLARYLIQQGREISITHQQIALELGTAREVITRLLKDFEQRGWVETSRGRILLCKLTDLETHADL